MNKNTDNIKAPSYVTSYIKPIETLMEIYPGFRTAIIERTPYTLTITSDELKRIRGRYNGKLVDYLGKLGINLNILSSLKPNDEPEELEYVINEMRKSEFINEKRFEINGVEISSFNFTRGAFYNNMWDKWTTKARGLFIEWTGDNTPRILARGYEKFFYISEGDVINNDISIEYPVTGSVKYNGFLGILGWSERLDDVVFCSKSEVSNPDEDSAFYANEFKRIFDLGIGRDSYLFKQILHILKSGYSLVFEVLSKNDPHIISRNLQEDDSIVLLDAIRSHVKFEVMDYQELKSKISEICTISRVKFKEDYNMKIYIKEDFQAVIRSIKDSDTHKEGFVFRDSIGRMWKVKTKYYNDWKFLRDKTIPESRTRENPIQYIKSLGLNKVMEDTAILVLNGDYNNIVDARDCVCSGDSSNKIKILSNKIANDNRYDQLLKMAKESSCSDSLLKSLEYSVRLGYKLDISLSPDGSYYILDRMNSSESIKSLVWDTFNDALRMSLIRFSKNHKPSSKGSKP